MAAPFTEAFPLAVTAVDELKSTMMLPGTLKVAFPDTERAPPAVGSRT